MKTLFLLLILIFSLSLSGQNTLNINGSPCGINGSARQGTMEFDQNTNKNRSVFPTANDFDKSITLEMLIAPNAVKDKFSMTKAVEIKGYVFNVKPGGIESCNCKTKDLAFRDTHIEITPNDHETGPDKRLVVEVTPRFRQAMLAKGEDWSTQTLKNNMMHHMVKIQGWLFYDGSHEGQSFANNPKNESGANWRASCWEIHPVTSIEVLDAEEEDAQAVVNTSDETDNPNSRDINPAPVPPPVVINHVPEQTAGSPLNTLIIIVIGAILGAVGQGIRVIIGLKKVYDEALKTSRDVKSIIEYKQMALSLVIAFAIGAVAGVLAAITQTNMQLSKSIIIAFIAAGYAGTDFIEGFMKKNTV